MCRLEGRGEGGGAVKEEEEQVKRHTSHVTRHTSHVTRHTSPASVVNDFVGRMASASAQSSKLDTRVVRWLRRGFGGWGLGVGGWVWGFGFGLVHIWSRLLVWSFGLRIGVQGHGLKVEDCGFRIRRLRCRVLVFVYVCQV